MAKAIEIISGYVVSIKYARNWPLEHLFENARSHPKENSLEGQSIESGFVLIGYPSVIRLLDPHATPLILDILLSTKSKIGIQIRVEREFVDNFMKSILITEI